MIKLEKGLFNELACYDAYNADKIIKCQDVQELALSILNIKSNGKYLIELPNTKRLSLDIVSLNPLTLILE